MKTIQIKSITCILLFIIILGSCKTPGTLENKILNRMPSSFTSLQDSVSMAETNWRNYFQDSFLVALIDTALNQNLDLLAAFQKAEAAGASVLLNHGALMPNVEANAAFSQRKFGLYTMDGAGNITTEITPGKIVPIHLQDYYAGFRASWEVDVWGKLRNRKKAAIANFLASIEGRNFVTTALVSEIAIIYYDLLALDNELEIIRETIRLQEKSLEMAKVQNDAAVVSALVVQQFEAQLLNTQAMEFGVLQRITEDENRINFLLGRFPTPVPRDRGTFLKPFSFSVKTGLPAHMLKNRPDIRQAELELSASKADVQAARAAFYPSLNIDGAAGLQAFKTTFLFTTPESVAYGIAAGLAAPLINRSAIKAEFKAANAKQLEFLFNYQKSILNGYIEVSNELSNIRNLEKIQDFKLQQTQALSNAVEVADELFKGAKANYLEVLLAQQNALQSKLDLLETKKRQYISFINIYRALGGGWK